MEIKHLYLLFILITQFYFSFARTTSGEVNSLESVPDLENAMYLTVNGYPCVRLLNLSGEIGCANPGREKVVAPVVRLKDVNKFARPAAVLVSQGELQNFFIRVLNDHDFRSKVAGVLVESKSDVSTVERGFSPVEKFPQAKFAPYKNNNYEWNPTGSNIMWNKYNFPVFLLSQDSTLTLQQIASKNGKNKKAFTVDVAEFDLVMQTTKAGTHDSESCLKQQSCLPLGGYSVLSSLPPINDISEQPKSILLVVASMDSASFFRDNSPGADSPMSGMISLLAAVDALSHIDAVNEFNKQLVFLVLTGEAWGYLGSRRFLAELDMGSDVVHGLNRTLIELVMEVGSVGKAFDLGVNSLFTHASGGSSVSDKLMSAFQDALESLGSSIKVTRASKSNPGIPPSSLMTFLRKNSSLSGLVLEDFDTAFTNEFYNSHLDDLSNINSSAIARAASLVSRTLYILASEGKESNQNVLNSINVNSSLVEELLGCLLTCKPGLSCALVEDYIAPISTCPNHYVGVLVEPPSSTPILDYVSDVSRFVWNFLAERTSTPKENASSACTQDCSRGEVCIRSEKKGKGTCVVSTTRY
ncbi:Nicastrin [Thalictrum thalictroides]|uniref:Nicastrin n=1 Tax=Thalictrum thalictroides TaxID=46969 RepID=A0A7J6W1G4_THATH|nr:Nicastrin [Thalictrum thalictroides]